MKTTRVLSTISYNSHDFLKLKLDALITRGILEFWAYMEHYPEKDETKKHKHLFFIPAKRIDTMQFTNELKEIDTTNPLSKPLGCIAVRPSKFADWFLYALHDKQYLSTKAQSREYSYKMDEIITSDTDYLIELTHQIDYSKYTQTQRLTEAVSNHIPFNQLVTNGQIPVQQIRNFQLAYQLIYQQQMPKPQERNQQSYEPLQVEDLIEIDTETEQIKMPFDIN